MTWVSYPLNTRALIISAIKKLRHLSDGFDSSDGFNIAKIEQKGVDYLSKAKRKKLQQYFDYFDKLSAKPYQIVKPRSQERRQALADYSGQELLKGVKAVFIPASPGQKLKIRYNRKGTKVTSVKTNGITRWYYEFDKFELMNDPETEIRRAIESMPEANVFIIKNGEFTIDRGYDAASLVGAVEGLMFRYLPAEAEDDDEDGYELDTGTGYLAWLKGIYGFNTRGPSGYKAARETIMKRPMAEVKAREKEKRSIKKQSGYSGALMMINKARAEKGLAPIVPRPPEVTKKNKKKKSHPRAQK